MHVTSQSLLPVEPKSFVFTTSLPIFVTRGTFFRSFTCLLRGFSINLKSTIALRGLFDLFYFLIIRNLCKSRIEAIVLLKNNWYSPSKASFSVSEFIPFPRGLPCPHGHETLPKNPERTRPPADRVSFFGKKSMPNKHKRSNHLGLLLPLPQF